MNNDTNTSPANLEEQPQPQPAIILLEVSSDGMEATMTLKKADDKAPVIKPTYDEIKAAIAAKGIVFGINEAMIKAACGNPIYNRPYVIARGSQPKTGNDGYLRYLIETTRDLKPKLRENGTVDYRDLGFTQNVMMGDPLCEIHPAEKGSDGHNVLGKVNEGHYGKDPKNPSGKNTYISEDGTMLHASCNGTAEVRHGIVEVSDVLKINGNVDNSTGDIDFVGDVIVSGDVLSGFVIKSLGTVTVRGCVESATIIADGDITVGEGINGMNRGLISSKGNIKCKYIQNCTIKAGENVYSDSIMYCMMECSGNVELTGKRATLIGGRSFIAGKLQATTIGTSSHIQTYVIMAATGVEKQRQLDELALEVKKMDVETQKLLQIMARYDDLIKKGKMDSEQAKGVVTVRDNYIEMTKRREKVCIEMEQIKREQMEASLENSYIVCKNRVHSGVQITFGPLIINIQPSVVNCRIQVIDDEIKVLNM